MWFVEWSVQAISVIMFFFFFKQKTAYEMRISDWSSDVCSSDLPARLAPAGRQARFGLAAAPSSPPSPPRGAAQLPRRTPRHPFISSRKFRALNDPNVIDRFLQAFITYIDSGFGLLGPDAGSLTAKRARGVSGKGVAGGEHMGGMLN